MLVNGVEHMGHSELRPTFSWMLTYMYYPRCICIQVGWSYQYWNFSISVLFILDVHCIYIFQVLEPSKEPDTKKSSFRTQKQHTLYCLFFHFNRKSSVLSLLLERIPNIFYKLIIINIQCPRSDLVDYGVMMNIFHPTFVLFCQQLYHLLLCHKMLTNYCSLRKVNYFDT
jgi:hypothetical protein